MLLPTFSRLPPQCTSPERQLPKRPKPHCNSTSGMSEIGAKRVQHTRRAILGKHCVAFCVNVVAHLFYVAISVYISREAASKESKTALQFHCRYVKNWRQACATRTQSNPIRTRSSATAEKQRVGCPHGGRVGLDRPAPSPSVRSGYTYAYG